MFGKENAERHRAASLRVAKPNRFYCRSRKKKFLPGSMFRLTRLRPLTTTGVEFTGVQTVELNGVSKASVCSSVKVPEVICQEISA